MLRPCTRVTKNGSFKFLALRNVPVCTSYCQCKLSMSHSCALDHRTVFVSSITISRTFSSRPKFGVVRAKLLEPVGSLSSKVYLPVCALDFT